MSSSSQPVVPHGVGTGYEDGKATDSKSDILFYERFSGYEKFSTLQQDEVRYGAQVSIVSFLIASKFQQKEKCSFLCLVQKRIGKESPLLLSQMENFFQQVVSPTTNLPTVLNFSLKNLTEVVTRVNKKKKDAKDLEKFFDGLQIDNPSQDLFNYHLLSNVQLPGGWNSLKKGYIFVNDCGELVNYRGTPLDNLQPYQTPRKYAYKLLENNVLVGFGFKGEMCVIPNFCEYSSESDDDPQAGFGQCTSDHVLVNPGCHPGAFLLWIMYRSNDSQERLRFRQLRGDDDSYIRLLKQHEKHFSKFNTVQLTILTEFIESYYGVNLTPQSLISDEDPQVFGFREFSRTISRFTPEMVDTFNNNFAALNQSLGIFAENVKQANERSTWDRILEGINFLSRTFADIVAFVNLKGNALHAYIASTVMYWGTLASASWKKFNMLPLLKALLISNGVNVDSNGNAIQDEPQSGSSDVQTESLARAVIGFLGDCFGLPTDPKTAHVRIEKIRGMDSLLNLGQKIARILTNVVESALSWFSNYTKWNPVVGVEKRIAEWFVRVSEFEVSATEVRVNIQKREGMTRLMDVLRTGYALREELIVSKNTHMLNAINSTLRTLEGKFDPVAPYLYNEVGGDRRPVTVYIYGNAGIGKSRLINHLMTDVFKRKRIGKFDPAKDVFYRPKESEYNDGYIGQKVFLFDDIFVTRDMEAARKDAKRFIEITGGNTCHMNMASLQFKASTYFTSDFVLATSNKPLVVNEFVDIVTDTQALFRRVQFPIQMLKGVNSAEDVEAYKHTIFRIDGVQHTYRELVKKVADKYEELRLSPTESYGYLSDDGDCSGDEDCPVVSEAEEAESVELSDDSMKVFAAKLKSRPSRFRGFASAKWAREKLRVGKKKSSSHNDLPALEEDFEESVSVDEPQMEHEDNRDCSSERANDSRGLAPFFRSESGSLPSRANSVGSAAPLFASSRSSSVVSLPNSFFGRLRTVCAQTYRKMWGNELNANEPLLLEEDIFYDCVNTPGCSCNSIMLRSASRSLHQFNRQFCGMKEYTHLPPPPDVTCQQITDRYVDLMTDGYGSQFRHRVQEYRMMKPDEINRIARIQDYDLDEHIASLVAANENVTSKIIKIEVLVATVAMTVVAAGLLYAAWKLLKPAFNYMFTKTENLFVTDFDHVPQIGIAPCEIFDKIVPHSIYESRSRHCHTCFKCGIVYTHVAVINACARDVYICSKCEREQDEAQSAPNTEMPARIKAKTKVLWKPQVSKSFEKAMKDDLADLYKPCSLDSNSIEAHFATAKNYVTLTRVKTSTSLRGIVVEGNVLLTTSHFFLDWEDGEELIVNSPSIRNIRFALRNADILRKISDDCALIQLPKTVAPFRSIVHHFIDVDDVPMDQPDGMLPILMQEGHRSVLVNKMCRKISVHERVRWDYLNTVLNKTVTYDCCSEPGDCGSPLFVLSSRVKRKILGIHISGKDGNRGRSTIVTNQNLRQWVDELIEQLNEHRYNVVDDEFEVDEVCQAMVLFDNDSIDCFGYAQGPASGGDTEFTKSLLFDVVYPVEKIPTRTRPHFFKGERVNPLDKAECVNHFEFIDQKLIDMSLDNLTDVLKTKDNGKYERRLLTMEECVNGIRTNGVVDPWLGGMEMSTSPGYPLCLDRKKPGKLDFVSMREDGTYELSDIVVQMFDKMDEKIKAGKDLDPVIFLDTPKDELLPINKVLEKDKVRIFCNGPFHANLVFRKYFGTLIAWIMSIHEDIEIKVGINVHSEEWKHLYEYLRLDDSTRKVIGGDWKGWDKSISYQLADTFTTFANNWYNDSEENQIARISLGKLFYSAYHLNRNVVYKTHGTIPSGFPATAVANSFVNCILMRVVYLRAMEKKGLEMTLERYIDSTSWAFYGDDNLGTVDFQTSQFLDMNVVAEIAVEMGMEYTHPSKEVVSEPFLKDDEITFIKRSFRLEENMVFAPLDEMSWKNIINYRRKSSPPYEAIKASFDSFRIEAIHYGQEVYDLEVNKVREHILKLGLFVSKKDRQRLMAEVWGNLKPLGLVSSQELLRNILYSFVEMESHHVWSCEIGKDLTYKKVFWCPRYLGKGIQTRGGNKENHHTCPSCKGVVLHLVKWSDKESERKLCLRCLNFKPPVWYFHNASLCDKCEELQPVTDGNSADF